MTELTSPDNIAKWTLQDAASLTQESQTQGDSIQAAFNKRQRYDFVWADDAARMASTGMVQGSRGYQIDTKSEYDYDASNWRLAAPFIQFDTSGFSVPSGVVTGVTNWSVNTTLSTDTSLVTVSSNTITIPQPGIYALSLSIAGNDFGGTFNGTHFLDFQTVVSPTIIGIGTWFANVAQATVPYFRTSSANFQINMLMRQNTGATGSVLSTASSPTNALRIGRIA